MPTKAQDKTNKGLPETVWVRCELNKEMKKRVQSRKQSAEEIFGAITRLVDDGFKLSLAKDFAHDCVGAYLTAPREQGQSRTFCLSARGPDTDSALKCLLFKHYDVLQGDWSGAIDPSTGEWDPWG